MNTIKQFHEIRVDQVNEVGGKGANLGEMTYVGIKVPEGFVVTSEAYRVFLQENQLDSYLVQELQKAGEKEEALLACAKDFRERILQASFPEKIAEKLQAAYETLGEQERVAVRSSATAEDLEDASFAGQQETYLNVTGFQDVLSHIQKCYASLWGNRAVIYRKNQGFDQANVALAVVVQRMVESEVAGVLFTVNPINGDANQIQINASYGLGESVVSGRVTADSYICDRNGNIIHKKLGTKETQIIYDVHGGTREIQVPISKQKSQAMSDGMIQALCEEGKKIEAYYGKPMDIEWGILDEQIYILQARAITTLQKKESSSDEALIQSYLKDCKCSGAQRGNLAFLLEKMPEVFLPYDYELIEIIDDQKSVILSEVGIHMDMQPQIDDDGIMILPPNGVKIGKGIIHFPRLWKSCKDLKGSKAILEKEMKGFHQELQKLIDMDYSSLSIKECGECNTYLMDYIRRLTYCRFRYALFPSAIAKGKLTKYLRKVDPNLTAFDLYQNLSYETALMTKDIEAMAYSFSKEEALKKAIKEGISYEEICAQYQTAKAELERFLKKHGYKSDFNCYCVSAKAFYEEPDRILHLVKPLLDLPQKEEKNGYQEILTALKTKVSANQYEILLEEIEAFRYLHVIREESQMMWETVFYYTKQLLKQISKHLFNTEDYMDQLVYLFSSEVSEICKEGDISEELIEKITRRKQMRPLAEKVWENAKLLVFEDTGDKLKGVSGSVGETSGKVCIINGPEEFYKMKKGDVLVCKLTDPEWTPLFSLASAVVADTGAELSHAAIVAREYGIPAVLGVGFATKKYKDGDLIHVNGTKGYVSKAG